MKDTADLLHSLFLRSAENAPARIAIVSGTRQISYCELLHEVEKVAACLRDMGDNRGKLLAVVMQRGWEQVAACLAIHCVGGAYLPIDPSLPMSRIQQLLQLGEVNIVLVQAEVASQLKLPESVSLICVPSSIPLGPSSPPLVQSPDSLAYVIFTSGSTGVPKGVMIDHKGAVNTINDINQRFSVTSEDRVLALSSLCFDLSVYDIFGSLAAGATVVFPDPAKAKDPPHWYEMVSRFGVTIWNSVPALMELLCEYLERQNKTLPDSLRLALLSGDWIPLSLPSRIAARNRRTKIVSLGGATEASIWSVLFPIEGVDPSWRSIPYGKALRNQSVRILDSNMRACPPGVEGELYIGGVGVALGYWKDPAHTRESFVLHPESGERMYKTGDLGRWQDDGNIEFLGRKDFQVQVRGFRVELGEIESALLQHEDIRACVVVPTEERSAELRLVAYIIPKEEQVVAGSVLREYLRVRLPEYMVPSEFIELSGFPLTSSGKVDRRQLPHPLPRQKKSIGGEVSFTNEQERKLAEMWTSVLGGECITRGDDFFSVGGDSLRAIRLASGIRDVFGIEAHVADVYDNPRFTDMAAWISYSGQPEKETLTRFVELNGSANHGPLTPEQEDLWLHAMRYVDQPVYNECFLVQINEPVNTGLLEDALKLCSRRHAVLRTSIVGTEPGPTQYVRDQVDIRLHTVDLQEYRKSERETRAKALADEMARAPFDLGNPPMFRFCFVRFDESESRLYIVAHHLLVDAVSFYDVLIPELERAYRMREAGLFEDPREGKCRFVDYARWRRKVDNIAVTETDRAYWSNHLQGVSPPDLPTDYPRNPSVRPRGARIVTSFDPALCKRIIEVGRSQGVTLFSTLLAAYSVLISRYCGQSEFAVGTVVDTRNSRPLETMMGYLIRPTVLKCVTDDSWSFLELLRVTQTELRGVQVHANTSISQTTSSFRSDGKSVTGEYLRTMFVLEPEIVHRDCRWVVHQLGFHPGTTKFELEFELEERNGTLLARVEYNTDLFKRATIERIVMHFNRLLEVIVADPTKSIGDLQFLGRDELKTIAGFSAPLLQVEAQGSTIHELIQNQARTTPLLIALESGTKQLSYQTLDDKSNRLARFLGQIGIEVTSRIAVCLPRGEDLVVSIIAALKAGAAFVPLDVQFPKERLRFMMDDCTPAAVITLRSFRHLFEGLRTRVVVLDDIGEADLNPLSREVQLPHVKPTAPAYIIYTSGSSGHPKGVVIRHSAVTNLVAQEIELFRIGPGERVLQFYSVGADAAISEIFRTLASGATLCVVDRSELLTGPLLERVLRRHSISIADLPPSIVRQMSPTLLPGLETVIVGGEPCTIELVRRWAPGRRMFNAYGPTECTVTCTLSQCFPTDTQVTIGRPIGGAKAFIVDSHRRMVPIGVPGEILVGGAGVADGYLNRPQLTGEKFIQMPVDDNEVENVFCTGDRGRFLENGEIQFLGRCDNQVKVRGFRVELGEVEAVLLRHPQVAEAVVVQRSNASDDTRLIAYFTARSDAIPDRHSLVTHLQKFVPDYMVPPVICVLPSLPHLPNGKVDRQALASYEEGIFDQGIAYVAPRNLLEKNIVDAFAEVLGVKPIGIDHDFFVLGGHSLNAAQVMQRVAAFTGGVPRYSLLFDFPTPRVLAEALADDISNTHTDDRIDQAPSAGPSSIY